MCNNIVVKDDNDKLRLDLVPLEVLAPLALVREFAYGKYGKAGMESWDKIEDERYFAALLRHLVAYQEDNEAEDEESGLPAIYHVLCNAAFLAIKHYRKIRKPKLWPYDDSTLFLSAPKGYELGIDDGIFIIERIPTNIDNINRIYYYTLENNFENKYTNVFKQDFTKPMWAVKLKKGVQIDTLGYIYCSRQIKEEVKEDINWPLDKEQTPHNVLFIFVRQDNAETKNFFSCKVTYGTIKEVIKNLYNENFSGFHMLYVSKYKEEGI